MQGSQLGKLTLSSSIDDWRSQGLDLTPAGGTCSSTAGININPSQTPDVLQATWWNQADSARTTHKSIAGYPVSRAERDDQYQIQMARQSLDAAAAPYPVALYGVLRTNTEVNQ
ncbi:uncharacterized protein N7500_004134 [Penicillium coprophilum]|uniref:uncharacterized protein n=1 Tax=Penicillium coprophilum TaxID=36646 RepID=UPI0023921EEF|nr:uncharacterized protein N7500_004134 [Penicillium coprophilum]KAJ5171351.1 hypothetical protein N7500_004134 [Penicillium coprophilum]